MLDIIVNKFNFHIVIKRKVSMEWTLNENSWCLTIGIFMEDLGSAS